jgi:hypothetical protein
MRAHAVVFARPYPLRVLGMRAHSVFSLFGAGFSDMRSHNLFIFNALQDLFVLSQCFVYSCVKSVNELNSTGGR